MRAIWNKRNRVILLLAVFLSIVTYHYSASAGPKNGFDVSNAIIPAEEILSGGPPKDGIPALSDPELIDAEAASYLTPDDRVIGVTMDGVSRAYPIAILNWHEIVNDTISDVLLYDRETESLWSQIMGQAVAGELVGEKLEAFPVSHTTWRDWVKQHPDTQVLSTDTGYSRDYGRNGVNQRAPDTYHPKEQVIGLEIDGVFKAYPFAELEKNNQSQFQDSINGVSITIDWDSENRSVELFDSSGKRIAGIQGFWFAWFAFHSD